MDLRTSAIAALFPEPEVGFLNVSVHEYVDVDDELVIDRLEHHEDLREFAVQVGAWLSQQ